MTREHVREHDPLTCVFCVLPGGAVSALHSRNVRLSWSRNVTPSPASETLNNLVCLLLFLQLHTARS